VNLIERLKQMFAKRQTPKHHVNPLSFAILEEAKDEWPIPPEELMQLVAATENVPWFINGGYVGYQSIVNLLRKNGVDLETIEPILDFGCGCGRVSRHWQKIGKRVYGVDYNEKLVAWCQENLPFGHFSTNQLQPPLDFADSTFGLAYALSVFTHLPEEVQLAWIQELSRVIKPGGYLVFTTHGEYYLFDLAPEQKEAFQAGQLVVRFEEEAGTNLCGAFHPLSYVEETLIKGCFELVDFISQGAKGNPRQDIYLLRNLTTN
jgi:SAM-dependent methyltransferase